MKSPKSLSYTLLATSLLVAPQLSATATVVTTEQLAPTTTPETLAVMSQPSQPQQANLQVVGSLRNYHQTQADVQANVTSNHTTSVPSVPTINNTSKPATTEVLETNISVAQHGKADLTLPERPVASNGLEYQLYLGNNNVQVTTATGTNYNVAVNGNATPIANTSVPVDQAVSNNNLNLANTDKSLDKVVNPNATPVANTVVPATLPLTNNNVNLTATDKDLNKVVNITNQTVTVSGDNVVCTTSPANVNASSFSDEFNPKLPNSNATNTAANASQTVVSDEFLPQVSNKTNTAVNASQTVTKDEFLPPVTNVSKDSVAPLSQDIKQIEQQVKQEVSTNAKKVAQEAVQAQEEATKAAAQDSKALMSEAQKVLDQVEADVYNHTTNITVTANSNASTAVTKNTQDIQSITVDYNVALNPQATPVANTAAPKSVALTNDNVNLVATDKSLDKVVNPNATPVSNTAVPATLPLTNNNVNLTATDKDLNKVVNLTNQTVTVSGDNVVCTTSPANVNASNFSDEFNPKLPNSNVTNTAVNASQTVASDEFLPPVSNQTNTPANASQTVTPGEFLPAPTSNVTNTTVNTSNQTVNVTGHVTNSTNSINTTKETQNHTKPVTTTSLTQKLEDLASQAADKAHELVNTTVNVTSNLAGQVAQVTGKFYDNAKQVVANVTNSSKKVIENVSEKSQEIVNNVTNTTTTLVEQTTDTAKEITKQVVDKAKDLTTKAQEQAKKVAQEVSNVSQKVAADTSNTVYHVAQVTGTFVDKSKEIVANVSEKAQKVVANATETTKKLVDQATDTAKELVKDAKKVANTVKDTVTKDDKGSKPMVKQPASNNLTTPTSAPTSDKHLHDSKPITDTKSVPVSQPTQDTPASPVTPVVPTTTSPAPSTTVLTPTGLDADLKHFEKQVATEIQKLKSEEAVQAKKVETLITKEQQANQTPVATNQAYVTVNGNTVADTAVANKLLKAYDDTKQQVVDISKSNVTVVANQAVKVANSLGNQVKQAVNASKQELSNITNVTKQQDNVVVTQDKEHLAKFKATVTNTTTVQNYKVAVPTTSVTSANTTTPASMPSSKPIVPASPAPTTPVNKPVVPTVKNYKVAPPTPVPSLNANGSLTAPSSLNTGMTSPVTKDTTTTSVPVINNCLASTSVVMSADSVQLNNSTPKAQELQAENTSVPTVNNTLNPTSVGMGPGPVIPNETMPAVQQGELVAPMCSHTPRVQLVPELAQALASKTKDLTVSQPAPDLFSNPKTGETSLVRTYNDLYYPTGVNPLRKGVDKIPTNLDLGVNPNPSSVPANVTITVDGVFYSASEIAQAGWEDMSHQQATTVLSTEVQQLAHPQQTLMMLRNIEAGLATATEQAAYKLAQASLLYVDVGSVKNNTKTPFLFTSNSTLVTDLRSIGVPVSPANLAGYWPNPRPSVNNVLQSEGYALNTLSSNYINPLVQLIPDYKPVVTITGSVIYEANTGSFKIPTPVTSLTPVFDTTEFDHGYKELQRVHSEDDNSPVSTPKVPTVPKDKDAVTPQDLPKAPPVTDNKQSTQVILDLTNLRIIVA